jgi:hypothetical protein
VLSEQLAGLLGSRYFPDPAGEVLLVVYELEDGIGVGFSLLFFLPNVAKHSIWEKPSRAYK